MRWLGYKKFAAKSIVCDAADIKRRMKSPHVAALAEDENDSGMEYIHAPTVRGEDRRLICGRDRMAGALLNKRKKLWFHVVDCDDNEAAELEEKENIYRRHSEGERASALARLVALQAQKIRAEEAAASCDTVTPLGAVSALKSSQTVTAEARKMVARAAGITPAAVRQAEVRAAAREAESSGPSTAGTLPAGGSKHAPAVGPQPALTEAPLELPEKFDAFGLDVPEASRSVIVSTVEWLGDWDGQLRGLLRELSEMEKHGPYAVAPAHLQRIRERIEAAGHAVRDAIPTSLCFYCKAQPASMATCPPCGQTGVVGRRGSDNVPPELKAGGAGARVAVDGKFVPAGGAANAAAAAGFKAAVEKAKAKRIKVRGPDGAEIPLPEDESQAPADDEELAFR